MPSRNVRLLGGLGVDPAARLSLPGRRVLAYLALAGNSVSRSYMASAMWPDVTDDVARANLRRAIWQLPKGWVACESDMLVLDAAVDLPDARRVAMRAVEGNRLSFSDVELLSVDVLPGWYEDWVVDAQDDYRLLRVQALEAACRTLVGAGELAVAAQAGKAAVRAEPLRESALAALVDAHLAAGNRYDAVTEYRGYATRLRHELGLDPGLDLSDRVNGLAT